MKQIREVAVKHLFTYALLPPLPIAGLVYGVWHLCAFLDGWMLYAALAVAAVVGYYLLKRFAVGLVLVYKAFAPMSLRDSCRYTPTCSQYAVEAIMKYGALKGGWMAFLRILRCNPFFRAAMIPCRKDSLVVF